MVFDYIMARLTIFYREWLLSQEKHFLFRYGKFRGEKIAGGTRFVLWLVKGDQDFICNLFDVPGHWSSKFPCTVCKAVSAADDPAYQLNFASDAHWKSTVWDDMVGWQSHG